MKALFASLVAAVIAANALPAAAADAAAANKLLKANDCTKCHAVDKDKKGPSYKKVAAKYKGKPDAEEKLVKHLTDNPMVKLDDGTEEEHKAFKGTPAEMQKVILFILTQ